MGRSTRNILTAIGHHIMHTFSSIIALPTFAHVAPNTKFKVQTQSTMIGMACASVSLRRAVRNKMCSTCMWTSKRSLCSISIRNFNFRTTALHHCTRQSCAVVSTNSSLLNRSLTTEAAKVNPGDFTLVYTGPLKGAVKALKIFSLSTAVLASCGGPVLVWLGKESVPVAARLALCSVVLLVGLSTTAILHWLLKGYITRLYYQPETQRVAAHTLSLLARQVRNEFETSEMRPPTGLAGFSTFQARDRAYFMHTEVFPDKHLLSTLVKNEQYKK